MKNRQTKRTPAGDNTAPGLKNGARYKDTVFRSLFREKDRLLELYNAVSGKSCDNPELMEIVTLENAIYMGMKNDLAYLIDFNLHLYEHQSTANPNMPFRLLQYIVEEYGKLTAGENIYGSRLIGLPTPHFVVFYNGTETRPERWILRLSDAYLVKEREPELELRVLFLNINAGYNENIKEQCRTLREYMQYVDRVRSHTRSMTVEEAVRRAIEECIRENILRDFLLTNRAEVTRMSLYEFDEEAFVKDIRKTAFEDGFEDGMAQGELSGMAFSVIELLQETEPLPEELKSEILAQTDSAILSKWLKAAARAASLEEWKQLIN